MVMAGRARQIYGIGTDIVSVSRIKRLVDKYGEQFLKKAYHPKEIDSFARREEEGSSLEFLASRWAVKEATQKALCTPRLFFPEMFEQYNLVDSRRAKHFVGVEELCRRALDSVQDDRGHEVRKNLICIGGGLDFPDLEIRLQRSLKRSNVRIAKVVRGSRRIGVPKGNENRRWVAWKGCAALLRSSEDYSKPSMIGHCLRENCGELDARTGSIADGITAQDGLGVWMKKTKYGNTCPM